MTLPQWVTRGLVAVGLDARRVKQNQFGYGCHVETFARWQRNARRERKKRRLRRKLAPLVRRLVDADSRAMSARWTAYAELDSAVFLSSDSPGGSVDGLRVHVESMRHADGQISCVIAEPLTYDRFVLDGRPWPPEQSTPPVKPLDTFKFAASIVVKHTD